MSDKEGGQASYMTLREHFAGQVLVGLLSQNDMRTPQTLEEKEDIEAWRKKIYKEDAEYCYAMADAMIAARQTK